MQKVVKCQKPMLPISIHKILKCNDLKYLVKFSQSIMATKQPKLIVFDLDYTLWPFWVDTHVNPPFKRGSTGNITDSCGYPVKCYNEVPEVLKKLTEGGYTLGIASRTGEIKGAEQLIELFGWSKYFKYKQIFPGRKTTHFDNFKKESGINFEDMLFFDDEARNINDLRTHGVTSVLVKNGINARVVENGIKQFQDEHVTI